MAGFGVSSPARKSEYFVDTRELRNELEKMEARIVTRLARIEKTLGGPNGMPLVTRVALLENAERNRKWSLRAVWAAVVACLVKVVHDTFDRFP